MLNDEKITQSPVQTKNEQTSKAVFIQNFKKLYLSQSLEIILNDFAECYLEVSKFESLELERNDILNLLIRKEAGNA
jgi:hypothetical protein